MDGTAIIFHPREVRDIDEPFWNSMVGLWLGKSF